MTDALAPGSVIGILGGGQLGRMLSVAASRLGYRTHIYEPGAAPAADVAHALTTAAYDDANALRAFAESVDVITYEFENVPTSALDLLESIRPIRPNRRTLAGIERRPATLLDGRDHALPGIGNARPAGHALAHHRLAHPGNARHARHEFALDAGALRLQIGRPGRRGQGLGCPCQHGKNRHGQPDRDAPHDSSSTVDPVVRRASRSRCAWAASRSA